MPASDFDAVRAFVKAMRTEGADVDEALAALARIEADMEVWGQRANGSRAEHLNDRAGWQKRFDRLSADRQDLAERVREACAGLVSEVACMKCAEDIRALDLAPLLPVPESTQ